MVSILACHTRDRGSIHRRKANLVCNRPKRVVRGVSTRTLIFTSTKKINKWKRKNTYMVYGIRVYFPLSSNMWIDNKNTSKVVNHDNDNKGDTEGQYAVDDVGYKKIMCNVREQRSGVMGSHLRCPASVMVGRRGGGVATILQCTDWRLVEVIRGGYRDRRLLP